MIEKTNLNLRERHQLATKREIVAAALDLFEKQGFRATTIEDIAQDVGVSARTVYRHFATKGDLVLGWLPTVEALVQKLPLTESSPQALIAEIEGSIEAILGEHTEVAASEAAEGFARFRRLVSSDPDLQSIVSSWEARLVSQAQTRLYDQLGDANPIRVQMIIQLVAAPMSAAIEVWAHSADSDLLALYGAAREQRAQILCG